MVQGKKKKKKKSTLAQNKQTYKPKLIFFSGPKFAQKYNSYHPWTSHFESQHFSPLEYSFCSTLISYSLILGLHKCQVHNSEKHSEITAHTGDLVGTSHKILGRRMFSLHLELQFLLIHRGGTRDEAVSGWQLGCVEPGEHRERKEGLLLLWGTHLGRRLAIVPGFAGLLLNLKELALKSAIHFQVPVVYSTYPCRLPGLISQTLSRPLEMVFLHYSLGLLA